MMDTNWIKLCVWLILCTGLRVVNTLTLTASTTPNPAVKGTTSKHTVRCDFTVATNDKFQQLQLYLTGGASADRLIAQIFADQNPQWSASVPENLNGRGLLGGSNDQGFLTLALNDTQCSDSERSYKCRIQYTTDNAVQPDRIQTTTVTVEAAPKAPAAMVVSPQSDNITEYSEMTFTCSGNVGRPGGTFQWFTFNDNEDSSMTNVTDQATQGAETPDTLSESCTYTRNSGLTLNVTRTQLGKRLVVRCRVYHPTQGNPNYLACNDPNTDYCVMSPQIDVQYPVTVDVNSSTVTAVEGTDQTLTCNTQGNPLAHLIEWKRENENDTLSTDKTLTLSQLTLNDTGKYVCTAYNILEGSTRQDSVVVTLTVHKTTTPSPTTTPQSTTTGSTTDPDGNTATNKGGAGDDTTVIIIVVVVVLVVLVVVVVGAIVFIRRRKRGKEVEEPPEKPFNNHAAINTRATNPLGLDLVSDSKARPAHDNSNGYKNEDGLTYAELQFDNKPRSRRPLAIDDSCTDYSDVSMPQV